MVNFLLGKRLVAVNLGIGIYQSNDTGNIIALCKPITIVTADPVCVWLVNTL